VSRISFRHDIAPFGAIQIVLISFCLTKLTRPDEQHWGERERAENRERASKAIERA
jgi:hypothetical protein